MTFPVINVKEGLQLTEDGTDIVYLWPKDQGAYTEALVIAAVWLIQGQWKYDTTQGLDLLNKMLVHAPSLPVVQQEFRRVIGEAVTLSKLTVRIEGEEIFCDWEGAPGTEEKGTISVIEPPLIDEVVLVNFKNNNDNTISLGFTEELFPQVLPKPENFEMLETSAVVTSVSINGTHLFIEFDSDPVGGVLKYVPDDMPLRSVGQVIVTPFRVEVS